MNSLSDLTVVDLLSHLGSGQATAVLAAQAALDRLAAVEPSLHSFLTVVGEAALEQAAAVDQARDNGQPLGPLAGVPIALKDNICTRGIRTTCGSRILGNFVPPYDATVTQRLLHAGAILIGKTNCDEFAMGSSTENSAYGPSRNPWDVERVPGGSSGGSATAVAGRQAPLAFGSDTGGSIRQPASLCGIVGVKPTYGRVSRYGLVAYASSLDQIGPFARSVEDAALALQVISGHDPLDSTSLDAPVDDYVAACKRGVQGLRIGVPREYFASGVDPQVASAIRAAIELLCSQGAVAEECSLPSTDYALSAYYIVAPAEASSNLARYDGVRYGHRTKEYAGHIGVTEKSRDEGFGEEVKQRIMVGTYALSAGYYDAYYKRAQQVRTLIRRDFDAAFAKYDVLLTPTSPTVAFKIGEKSDDPMAMKLADICTIPANMAGICGLSLPCGFADGLPIGLQVLAPALGEAVMFQAAAAYEAATDWHTQRPPL
jgi:aspartyl-tRNA(Asn)/glutamyl-tRNA(Gln) amidotransferase subunit A